MRKKITKCISFLVILVFLSQICLVLATDIVSTNTGGVSSRRLYENHPSTGVGHDSAYSASFNASIGDDLSIVSFRLLKENDPIGHFQINITGHSGVFNTSNSLPNSTVYAYSDLYNLSDISNAAPAWYNFTFLNTYTFVAGEKYCAVLYAIDGFNGTTSHDMFYYYGSGVAYENGTAGYFANGVWATLNTGSNLIVYGESPDGDAPTYGAITSNTTAANKAVRVNCTVSDATAVDFVIPSWNNTGAWVNQSAIDAGDALSVNANFTGTWNATVGTVVQVKFYSNDTLGNAGVSGAQGFTLTDETYPTYANINKTSTAKSASSNFSCQWTDETGLSGWIFETNNTGVATNESWTAFTANPGWANLTDTLNNTGGVLVAFRWFVNDSSNNWNVTTLQTFTITNARSLKAEFKNLDPPPYRIGQQTTINVSVIDTATNLTTTTYELNITRDGSPWKQNFTDYNFTDIEYDTKSHTYKATEIWDSDNSAPAENVTNEPTDGLVVDWQTVGGGGGGTGGGGGGGGGGAIAEAGEAVIDWLRTVPPLGVAAIMGSLGVITLFGIAAGEKKKRKRNTPNRSFKKVERRIRKHA